MKKALITGIVGQDGSYMAELLLSKGYEVHGLKRRTSSFTSSRIDHIFNELHVHHGDILDFTSVNNLVRTINPDEIYHLAAQSHVQVSFEIPAYTMDTIVNGTLNVLEAVRQNNKNIKVYHAASSEMFGNAPAPQHELTRFDPQSPYACAKVCAFDLCKNYRNSYNMFVSNGICNNHESSRRGETFVTRKITLGVARIVHSLRNGIDPAPIHLGNLYSKRDFGYAKEYVEAMHLMLQQQEPDDFVIATGVSTSVDRFLSLAFDAAGLNPKDHVVIDPRYFRPAEVNHLLGDYSKIKNELGWEPKVSVEELAKLMVDHDINSYNVH